MLKAVLSHSATALAANADQLYAALKQLSQGRYQLGIVGGLGCAELEPVADIYDADEHLLRRLVRVSTDDAEAIAAALASGQLGTLDALSISDAEAARLEQGRSLALRNCGLIDPTNIGVYVESNGYIGSRKALLYMSPQQVCDTLSAAGLRGDDNALLGEKWAQARESDALYCQAAADGPGALLDRTLLESDPHSVIEGLLIAAYAQGAHRLAIVVPESDALARTRLENAIDQASEGIFPAGNIMGSGFMCDMQLVSERAAKSERPEILAQAPWIILYGAAAFAERGWEEK